MAENLFSPARAASANHFSLALYQQLAGSAGPAGLCASPFSVLGVLAMAAAGAHGATAAQMQQVLQLDPFDPGAHAALGSLSSGLEFFARGSPGNCQLAVAANRVRVRSGVS